MRASSNPAETWRRVALALANSKLIRRPLRLLKRLFRVTIPKGVLHLLRCVWPASLPGSPPEGTFSLLEELPHLPPGSGRKVLLDQGTPPTGPNSLMVISKLGQHTEQPWPIFWCKQSHARLVGKSLVLRNPQGQLGAEAVGKAARVADDPAYSYLPLTRPVHLDGNWTSVISRWVPTANEGGIFAHWFFEALPRLALLPEFPPDTRILVPSNLQPFQKETLHLMGLLDRVRPTKEHHLVLEEYYFTSPTSMIVCYDPYAVEFLRKTFLPFGKPPATVPDRVFLTRQIRGAANREEVESFFRRRGWTVLDSAQLSVSEQIGLFSRVKAVAGIHGAGFTNCLWCGPGTKIIELLSERHLSGCYEWLTQYLGGQHYFEIFPSDENSCARVDLQKLEVLLDGAGV